MTTPQDLRALIAAAFVGPWTYESWAIDCPRMGEGDECGYEHNLATVLSPDYPGEQVVAQIDVPGLESLAEANGQLIVAMRNHAERLVALWEAAEALDLGEMEAQAIANGDGVEQVRRLRAALTALREGEKR